MAVENDSATLIHRDPQRMLGVQALGDAVVAAVLDVLAEVDQTRPRLAAAR